MLAIALGDPTGIGPEVALKAVAAELPRDDERYLLIGDEVLVRDLNARLKLGLAISNSPDDASRVLIGAPVSAPARGGSSGPRRKDCGAPVYGQGARPRPSSP